MTPRRKPGVAFWATVVVVVALVGYPLSFIPACWVVDYLGTNWARSAFDWFYSPLAGVFSWLSYQFTGGDH